MKFLLDTADPAVVQQLAETGLVAGVTTNPTHLARLQRPPREVIDELLTVLPEGIIHVQVTELEPEAVYRQALRIQALSSRVVVKIPCVPQLFPVISRLTKAGVPVNMTLVFSVAQVACLANLGVAYVSPFIGRLYDAGFDGLGVALEMLAMLTESGGSTALLAASLRSREQVEEMAIAGAPWATIPPELFGHLLEHKLSQAGFERFAADWKQLGSPVFP